MSETQKEKEQKKRIDEMLLSFLPNILTFVPACTWHTKQLPYMDMGEQGNTLAQGATEWNGSWEACDQRVNI